MSDWNEYIFSDIADFKKGINYTSSDYSKDKSGIPFISIKCLIKGGGFDYTGIKFLTDRFDDNDKVRSGDLLFSITDLTREGDIVGSPLIIPLKYNGAVASMDLIRVKCDELYIDVEFLYFLMMTKEVRSYFINHSAGSTVLHLETASIPKFRLKLPSTKVQSKISNILRTAEAAIEKTVAAIAKYKAIKQGMLHDLFTRGIDLKTGKLRARYEDAPELYKGSKLGWVPKEWDDCQMSKYISENLYGPRFNAKDYSENGNVKTIRGTDFTKDGEILYKQAPMALLPQEMINTHRLENGDVIIVTTADCGLTDVFKKPINDVEFIPSAYSVKYQFTKEINPYYIKYFMATDKAIRQVNKFVRQGTLGNLPGSDVLRFDMSYPNLEEQNEVARKLKNMDNKLQTEQDYLHKLQEIKSGLMGDLLTSKKKVHVEETLTESTS